MNGYFNIFKTIIMEKRFGKFVKKQVGVCICSKIIISHQINIHRRNIKVHRRYLSNSNSVLFRTFSVLYSYPNDLMSYPSTNRPTPPIEFAGRIRGCLAVGKHRNGLIVQAREFLDTIHVNVWRTE